MVNTSTRAFVSGSWLMSQNTLAHKLSTLSDKSKVEMFFGAVYTKNCNTVNFMLENLPLEFFTKKCNLEFLKYYLNELHDDIEDGDDDAICVYAAVYELLF